jgi:condensin complex subunit 2
MKSSTSITMSALGQSDTTTLPEDLHVNSELFTVLFLKPKWRFSVARRVTTTNKSAIGANVVDQTVPIDNYDHSLYEPVEFVIEEPEKAKEEAVEPAADNFADDYYEPDNSQPHLSQPPTLSQATDSGNTISYTKRAKRLDVQHLKGCIWSTITTSQSHQKTTFSSLLRALPEQYERGRKEERGELSVQYAFLCLLHLANENGFVLDKVEGGGDLEIVAPC